MDIEEVKAEYKIMMKVLRHARYLQPAEYEAIKAATSSRRSELCDRMKKEVSF